VSGTTFVSAGLLVVAVLVSLGVVVATRPAARRLRGRITTPRALSWLTERVPLAVLVLVGGAVAVLGLVAMFVSILAEVTEDDELTAFDRRLIAWIADQRAAWDNSVVIALTDVGGKALLTGLLTGVALLVAYRHRSWSPVVVAAVAGLGGALLVASIKLIIGRDRPDPLQRAIVEDGFSFPSGHSTSAVAVLGTVAWLVSTLTAKRVVIATAWVAAALLAIGIGLSRIYLGVHYPSDVAAGWLLGTAWLIVTAIAVRLPDLHRPGRAATDHTRVRSVAIVGGSLVVSFGAILGAVGLTVLAA
jgi:undecaprenyl-diphosphatase